MNPGDVKIRIQLDTDQAEQNQTRLRQSFDETTAVASRMGGAMSGVLGAFGQAAMGAVGGVLAAGTAKATGAIWSGYGDSLGTSIARLPIAGGGDFGMQGAAIRSVQDTRSQVQQDLGFIAGGMTEEQLRRYFSAMFPLHAMEQAGNLKIERALQVYLQEANSGYFNRMIERYMEPFSNKHWR